MKSATVEQHRGTHTIPTFGNSFTADVYLHQLNNSRCKIGGDKEQFSKDLFAPNYLVYIHLFLAGCSVPTYYSQ